MAHLPHTPNPCHLDISLGRRPAPSPALLGVLHVKDATTHAHSGRVARYAALIAGQMGLQATEILQVSEAAWMHDIGKLCLPLELLQKPGALDEGEYAWVQRHAPKGSSLLKRMGEDDWAQVALYHHERWDGRGYPFGLVADRIPLAAQITSVADAYDAMVSDRPYRKGLPHAYALEELRRGSGQQFSPAVVEAFFAVEHGLAGLKAS